MRCIRSQLWVDVDIDRTLPASNRSLRRILLLVSGCCIIAKRKTRKTTFCNLTAMNCNYAVCTLQLSLTSAFRTPRSRALHMRLCTYAFLVHQKHIRPHTRVCMCIMMMMMAWGAAKGEIRLLTSPLHFMAMLGFYFFSIFCAVFSVFYFLHYVEASRFRCDSVSHSTGKLGAGRKEMGDAKLGNLWVLHHHKTSCIFHQFSFAVCISPRFGAAIFDFLLCSARLSALGVFARAIFHQVYWTADKAIFNGRFVWWACSIMEISALASIDLPQLAGQCSC